MTRNTGTWGGRDVHRARALMATTLPIKRHSCPTIVRAGDAWVVHHNIGRGVVPLLLQRQEPLMFSPSARSRNCWA